MPKTLWIVILLALFQLGQAQESLTLYAAGAQLPDLSALVEAFKTTNPGVEIKLFRSGAGEVITKLRAELEAGNPQPDLIWLVGTQFFQELSTKGLLRRVPPTMPGFPLRFAYEGGKYYEVRFLYNILAVNRNRLPKPPSSWRELTNPEYRGLVVMADPNYSGPALAALGTLTERYGFGYFEALKANGLRVEQSNPLLQQKLAQGEYALAITNDYGVRQEIAKGSPLSIVYPSDGAILAPTPIGIPTWSKNPALAEKFLRFLLSDRGQQVFAERGYYPVLAGSPGPQGGPLKILSMQAKGVSAELLSRFNALFGLR